MPSLADAFRVLAELRTDGAIEEYAVGGAMAMLFWAEPTLTFDRDGFVLLPPADGALVSLTPIYEWLRHAARDAAPAAPRTEAPASATGVGTALGDRAVIGGLLLQKPARAVRWRGSGG